MWKGLMVTMVMCWKCGPLDAYVAAKELAATVASRSWEGIEGIVVWEGCIEGDMWGWGAGGGDEKWG